MNKIRYHPRAQAVISRTKMIPEANRDFGVIDQ